MNDKKKGAGQNNNPTAKNKDNNVQISTKLREVIEDSDEKYPEHFIIYSNRLIFTIRKFRIKMSLMV